MPCCGRIAPLGAFEFRFRSTWMFHDRLEPLPQRTAREASPPRRRHRARLLDDWAAGPEESAEARVQFDRVLDAMDEALSP